MTEPVGIKMMIRKRCKQVYANKFDGFDEMDPFLEIHFSFLVMSFSGFCEMILASQNAYENKIRINMKSSERAYVKMVLFHL